MATIPAVVLSSAAPASTTSDLAKDVPREEPADPVFTAPVFSEPIAIDPFTVGAEAIFTTSAAPTSTTANLLKDVPFENKVDPSAPFATGAPLELTEPAASAATTSSAAPESTTAALAKDVPLEEPAVKETPAMTDSSEVPGAFPETPASELNKEIKLINPLPAAPGGVNPVKLAPGEPIPESLRTADINANVKLDPESYEKADAAIAGHYSATSLPPVSKNMIPESSLPIASGNDFHINSAAPVATTAALAGAVPLEKKAVGSASAPGETVTVPDVVKESQKEAGVSPEASGIPEEVREKEQVEEELLQKVPEAPATSEGTTSGTLSATEVVGGITAAAAGLGAAAYATATSAKDKAVEQGTPALEQAATSLPLSVKQALPAAVQEKIATTSATGGAPVTTDIPAEVKESFQESGSSPEAAANTEAVGEKKAVESELLKTVSPVASASEPSVPAGVNGSEPAPAVDPSLAAGTPAAPAAPGSPGSPVAAHSTIPAAVSSSAPGTSAPSSTGEKKKKNRISSFFHKVFESKKK